MPEADPIHNLQMAPSKCIPLLQSVRPETENKARKRVKPQIAPSSSTLLVLGLVIHKAFSRPATRRESVLSCKFAIFRLGYLFGPPFQQKY